MPRRIPRSSSSFPFIAAPRLSTAKNKKTDVAEHPKVFHHVGLLFNKPPG